MQNVYVYINTLLYLHRPVEITSLSFVNSNGMFNLTTHYLFKRRENPKDFQMQQEKVCFERKINATQSFDELRRQIPNGCQQITRQILHSVREGFGQNLYYCV